jgi:hypothetical protein
MGKRCLTINDGKPCDFLATDGTCLLDENEKQERCPALETVRGEDKDAEWMKPDIINREMM